MEKDGERDKMEIREKTKHFSKQPPALNIK